MHACYSQAAQADCLFAAVSMQFAYFSELSILPLKWSPSPLVKVA